MELEEKVQVQGIGHVCQQVGLLVQVLEQEMQELGARAVVLAPLVVVEEAELFLALVQVRDAGQ